MSAAALILSAGAWIALLWAWWRAALARTPLDWREALPARRAAVQCGRQLMCGEASVLPSWLRAVAEASRQNTAASEYSVFNTAMRVAFPWRAPSSTRSMITRRAQNSNTATRAKAGAKAFSSASTRVLSDLLSAMGLVLLDVSDQIRRQASGAQAPSLSRLARRGRL